MRETTKRVKQQDLQGKTHQRIPNMAALAFSGFKCLLPFEGTWETEKNIWGNNDSKLEKWTMKTYEDVFPISNDLQPAMLDCHSKIFRESHSKTTRQTCESESYKQPCWVAHAWDWLPLQVESSVQVGISKEVTCHSVGGPNWPKLMIFLGITVYCFWYTYHLFIYSCRLHSGFFWVSSCSFIFFSYDDFLFFPRKPEPLGTDWTIRRITIDDSTQAIQIELLEVHRYAIRQVSSVGWLVDWMTVKTYGNDGFSFWFGNTCGLLDWWIVGLLGVGCFFTSVLPPEVERKMLDGLGVGFRQRRPIQGPNPLVNQLTLQ